MRNLQTVKPKVPHLVSKNGDKTVTDQEAAELLCEFFKEEVVADKDDDGDTVQAEAETRKIPVSFERDKVKDLLFNLKTDKSPGPNGVHPIVIQRCAEEISLPLPLYFRKPSTRVSYQQTGN